MQARHRIFPAAALPIAAGFLLASCAHDGRSVSEGTLLEARLLGAPSSRPGGPAQHPDARFFTRNGTESTVLVTLHRDGALDSASCLPPKQQKIWDLARPGGAWKVSAQISDEKCEHRGRSCASLEPGAGKVALELRDIAGECAWHPMVGEGLVGLLPNWDPDSPEFCKYSNQWMNQLVTWNNESQRSVWVSIYYNGAPIGRTLREYYCVAPGQSRRFCVDGNAITKNSGWPKFIDYTVAYGYRYQVRAEVQVGPGCSNQVQCDTTFNANWDWPSNSTGQAIVEVGFNSNAQTCWWHWYK